MGPEFRRNLWLELPPRRIVIAAVLLSLVFFAAALSGGNHDYPASVARLLYYAIVVAWGARNAALSVVSEIRDRTWDAQRLSSLTAKDMVLGKLFGSTVYNWFAGAICLAVILTHSLVHDGPLGALIDLVYFLAIGAIAQAAALLASLVAVRRRQAHSRSEIFFYQLTGLAAAIAVFWVWDAADPAGSLLPGRTHTDVVLWWGHAFGARPFLLVSLALFAGWTLTGSYREMRLELKMQNGPFVWLAFLVFMGVYAAGFDTWLTQNSLTAGWDIPALRLSLAASTFAALTYVMVLTEPKDRVHFRWLGMQIASGRVATALAHLDGFTMSYAAAVLTSAFLTGWLWLYRAVPQDSAALIAAGSGFLTRDVAIFVFFGTLPNRRHGDFMAILVLFVLYVLVPSILNGLGLGFTLPFFYPKATTPVWLAPVFAWAEALAVAVPAFMNLAGSEKTAAAPASS